MADEDTAQNQDEVQEDTAPQQSNETLEEQPEAPQPSTEAEPEEPKGEPAVEGEPAEKSEPKTSYDDVEDDDFDPMSFEYGFANAPQQPDPLESLQQLPRNEDGTTDADAFSQWWKQQQQQTVEQSRQVAAQEFARLRQGEREWKRVEKQFPEVAKNTSLRKAIHKQRIGDIASGGKGDIVAAAREVMDLMRGTERTAKTRAKETIRVQRSAQLDSASNTPAQSNNARKAATETLYTSRNKTEREAAAESLLRDMLEKGEI